jgi:hypothetical protein
VNHRDDLVDVVLIDLPVEQFRRSQQYHDALLRELALIDSGSSTETPSTPRRLIELVERVGRQYGGFSVEPQSQLREALERQIPRVDVAYRVPRSTGKASLELGRLLDEVDGYCRRGELLTTAAPEEVLAFRRHYLEEIVRQIDGAAPRPWPDT